MKEAITTLEDVTEYLTSESLTETARSLSKVLCKIHSTWFSRRLNQVDKIHSKVTVFSK